MLNVVDPEIRALSAVVQGPSLITSLLLLGKATRALMGIKLAEIGLFSGQDELLLALDEHGTQPVSLIAERLAVRPSTVSKMLDRLVEKDLVRRFPNPKDARHTLVGLSANGECLIERIRLIHDQLDHDLLQHQEDSAGSLTGADIQRMNELVASRLRRLR